MITFKERFKQLIVENKLDYNSFIESFYKSYGYYIDCNDMPDVNTLKDLCEFFSVSCNYILGLSSNRGVNSKSSLFDEIMGLASIIFTSDEFSDCEIE